LANVVAGGDIGKRLGLADSSFMPQIAALNGPVYQSFGSNYQAEVPDNCHFTGMGKKTANIDIRVEPQLIEPRHD
jgi:hypothetical protein